MFNIDIKLKTIQTVLPWPLGSSVCFKLVLQASRWVETFIQNIQSFKFRQPAFPQVTILGACPTISYCVNFKVKRQSKQDKANGWGLSVMVAPEDCPFVGCYQAWYRAGRAPRRLVQSILEKTSRVGIRTMTGLATEFFPAE